jgi:hypothetical protein
LAVRVMAPHGAIARMCVRGALTRPLRHAAGPRGAAGSAQMCNMRHATYNAQHTTCSVQRAAYNVQRASCNVQRAACNVQHATCRMQRATCRMQRATCSMQRAACDVQHATCSIQRAAYNVQRAICSIRRQQQLPWGRARSLDPALARARSLAERRLIARRSRPARPCSTAGPPRAFPCQAPACSRGRASLVRVSGRPQRQRS